MSFAAPTILIVDDEIQNRKLLEALLRIEGYVTRTASNGEEALASVARATPDLILLDLMMPGMDGCALARVLKGDPATSHVPIIMVTAHSDRSARMAGLAAGAEEFLTTPVDRAELWLRVRNLLRLKALGDLVQGNSMRLEQQVQQRTAELHESEARFGAFMEASPVLKWINDADGRVLFTNKAWNGLFDIDPGDGRPRLKGGGGTVGIIGDTWASDPDPAASGEQGRGQVRVAGAGGASFCLDVIKFPIREASGRTVWGGIAIDVTQQRLAEQEILDLNTHLERRVGERTAELEHARNDANLANQAKSSFLAAMSHEIRTPMNGIVGMVDVLAHGHLSEHQGDAVRIIRESAFALLALLEDILDFSKIEAGRLELERMPVALADIAEGVCDTLSHAADKKNVDLFLSISPEGPAQVWSDPVRLRQVFYNLVGNAIKFSGGRAKRGRVELRLEVACAAPLRVRLQVVDNGIGMSPDTQEHMFESFRQAEVSTTRRFGGSGLGLAICKRLVELLDGTIAVQSTQWQGSTFTVELPLQAVEGSTADPLPDLAGLDYVLVAGADLEVETVRTYLESAGARTQVVDSGADALRACAGLASAVVVHGTIDGAARDALWSSFSGAPGLRHLLISRGRRREARLEGPNVVIIDGNSMRRRSFLHAAAVVAGRASAAISPHVLSDEPGTLALTAPTVTEARARNQLILVAEDDSTNQKVLLRQLGLLGYAAEVANDGLEAFRLWRSGGYALLLTDLHMPGLDGYGLTSAIRHEEGGGRRIPILALTANAMQGEASRAEAAGLDEYLTKPMQLDVLRCVLAKWLPLDAVVGAAGEAPPAAAGRGRAGPVLDIAVLTTFMGDDPGVLREVLAEFDDSLRKSAVDIGLALAVEDIDEVGRIAHRLKSASRTVGALQLGDLCAELDKACQTGDSAGVGRTMTQITPAIASLLETLEHCRSSNAGERVAQAERPCVDRMADRDWLTRIGWQGTGAYEDTDS